MRQEITRAHKGWALDAVVLDNDITRMMKEDIHTPPNEGQYRYAVVESSFTNFKELS
jgi:dynein heavy chain